MTGIYRDVEDFVAYRHPHAMVGSFNDSKNERIRKTFWQADIVKRIGLYVIHFKTFACAYPYQTARVNKYLIDIQVGEITMVFIASLVRMNGVVG